MTRPFACLVLALLGLLARPAAAQPAPGAPAGEPRLVEVRRLIDAGVRAYGPAAAVEPSLVAWLGGATLPALAGAGAVLSGDRLYLAREALEPPHRDTLVAAAIAYRLVDRPSRATTLAGYEKELRERTLEGNAKVVEVLERTKGLPEDGAVGAVAAWLIAQNAAAPDRQTATRLCEELRNLVLRFPRQAAAVPPVRCAEAGVAEDRAAAPRAGVVPALLVTIAPTPTGPARPGTSPPARDAAPGAGAASPGRDAAGGDAQPGGSGSDVPSAYCAAGHRLRYVYRCPPS